MTDNAEDKVPAPDPAAGREPAAAAADAQDPKAGDPKAGDTKAGDPKAEDPKAEDPKDDLVTTHHVITIDGAELRYTVTAGRVVIRQEGHTDDKFDGAEAKAEVFMVAYTLDDAD